MNDPSFLPLALVVQVKALISEAEARGLSFVYALSPGQDIIFSSSCDLSLLKRKLKQVGRISWPQISLHYIIYTFFTKMRKSSYNF